MDFIVQWIDFREKTIALEMGRSTAASRTQRLYDIVGYCGYMGLSKVVLRHPPDMAPSTRVLLEGLDGCPGAPALVLEPLTEGGERRPDGPCSLVYAGRHDEPGASVEYEFFCADMAAALENLTVAVLLAGYSIPLDENSLSRLRLCLYELGANTVEHGVFYGAGPEIRVSLVIGEDCIVAKFCDNAACFSTLRGKRVDVAEKISHRSKRGLGLFLLNRMTDGLSYERDASWNRTMLIIHRDKDASCHLNRRTDMNELKITVTPTDCRDTVVVKPAGSINSTTVPQMDACISQLIQSGQTTIVIDLSETEFISSSGVGLLLGTVSALRDKGGDMLLMRLPKLVNDIFDVLNIKMHFRILGDLRELGAEVRP
jgi:anti-sigma B factor antagonist